VTAAAAILSATACGTAPAPPSAATAVKVGAERTEACGLVSPVDATVTTGVGAWDMRATAATGRDVCQLASAEGPVIVVVTAPLTGGAVPAGLCAPTGSRPLGGQLGPIETTCRTTGPTHDTATLVAVHGRTAVGVRVTGFAKTRTSPDPGPLAAELLAHALTHL
jgi:hypothetical protein